MSYRIAFQLLIYSFLPPACVAAGFSSTTNGVYLVIVAVRNSVVITNEPFRVDDRLIWMTFCDTGKVELTHPLDVAYGINVKMSDASGKLVPKTSLGASFGSKFDRLKNITDCREYPVLAWGPYKDNPKCGGGTFLPRPGELFRVNKPGIYTMEIQMQMFRYVQSYDSIERSKTLFRFSSIKINVEKP